jgi:hypothetical protein
VIDLGLEFRFPASPFQDFSIVLSVLSAVHRIEIPTAGHVIWLEIESGV